MKARQVRLAIEWMETEDGKAHGWQIRIAPKGEEPEKIIPLETWDLKFSTGAEKIRFQSPAKARKQP